MFFVLKLIAVHIIRSYTYILNKTSLIIYEKLKTKAFASLDELYKSIIDEYEDYPKEYFEEVIKKFKEYGILK